MRLIIATIKPFKLDEARSALSEQGMTVTEFKVKIEAAVTAALVDRAAKVMQKAARTGQVGDGKIFVSRSSKRCRFAQASPAKALFEPVGNPVRHY